MSASRIFSAIIAPLFLLDADVKTYFRDIHQLNAKKQTDMWNRLNKSMMFCQMMFGLSFYGVMVILTRFFLEDLNYSEADTMMVVGAFSSIGPLFAIAGGFIADKFLGA